MAVLFLQGPLGPFFSRMVQRLTDEGIRAHKINFNGGDAWYSRDIDSVSYRGTIEAWPAYLEDFIRRENISDIFVYGDCRVYHRLAKEVARRSNIRFYAFEEGYIRPNHLTMELNGVNGYSSITRRQIEAWESVERLPETKVGNHLWNRVRFAMSYYIAGNAVAWRYPHYRHHRSFYAVYEAFCWVRAAVRHYRFRASEQYLLPELLKEHDGRYFLFPLQVANDAQIFFHSPYNSISDCIREVVASFARVADPRDRLVIKHHPMDRGHTLYQELIDELVQQHDLKGRLVYCHDQHLPTLLEHCKGVVTINSTTAISAFFHKAPVKVLGTAFYDIGGLCNQKSLEEFWLDQEPVDYDLFLRFRNFLDAHGQINGSFYKIIDFTVDQVVRQLKTQGALQLPEG
ncbi:MAG TPA: capsular biosynthesis protein [Oceanospirillales bacterium]|nr:capsular biosynthesis protein [Oceanospirillaceae bacterium]HBS42618.1 capsular biosynthesis protein [Oceanospirillales bacterium]|tara:strand:- start:30899 stop:32101 length:1203 start_codon:yes stop_codon:yes gene_type:complete